MGAAGKGRPRAAARHPDPQPGDVQAGGEYLLIDNEIRATPASSFLARDGRFEFTESPVTARALSAQFLGGPTRISVATRADGMIAINAQGTASASQIPLRLGRGAAPTGLGRHGLAGNDQRSARAARGPSSCSRSSRCRRRPAATARKNRGRAHAPALRARHRPGTAPNGNDQGFARPAVEAAIKRRRHGRDPW